MSFSHRGAILAFILLLISPFWTLAQEKTKEEVTFTTVDGVDIRGTFYRGNKGKNSPVAILLHSYRSDRSKGEWNTLAEILQRKNFAVLTFDFRGHGQSVDISGATFWKGSDPLTAQSAQFNAKNIKGGAKAGRSKINHKDFSNAYLPALVNDVVAARRFLDQKNDASECDTGNIFLIGAQEGAAIGWLWCASEWIRNTNPPPIVGAAPQPPRYGGADIAGAIWLSFDANPNKLNWQFANWRKQWPELRNKMPQLFLYGAEDQHAAKDSAFMYNTVLQADRELKNEGKAVSTYMMPVKKSALKGIGLLAKGTDTEELMTKYIDKILEKRTTVWRNQNIAQQSSAPVPLSKFGFR